MAFVLDGGPMEWSMTRDADGHREYKIKHLVFGERTDGPAAASLTPGLPLPGSYWAFYNDIDLWAFCQPNADIRQYGTKSGEPGQFFTVEQTFSTKNRKRCSEEKIDDPLLEPPKISGSFKESKEEATHDMFGQPILTSSHEMIRGPQVEFPHSQPTVEIDQNVSSFFQAFTLPTMFANCVNDGWLWGLPPRTILLKPGGWEKKYYGTCNVYYSRKLSFHIDYNGWDRDILDEGTKVLNGHWDTATGEWILDDIAGGPPDRNNPKHFKVFTDRAGNPCKVVLDGYGQPCGATLDPILEYVYVGAVGTATAPTPSNTDWVQQVGGDQPYDTSPFPQPYVKGEVVDLNGELFIAKQDITGSDAPQTGTSTAFWHFLPNGINDVGIYDGGVTYNPGDKTRDPSSNPKSQAGNIHVAKFNGANFLLLGIPLSF